MSKSPWAATRGNSKSAATGRRSMAARGLGAVIGLTILLMAVPAQAGSIHTVFFDSDGNPVPGTITASLAMYIRPYGGGSFGCCAPLGAPVFVEEFAFGIGSDFSVVIPQAIINTHAAWEMPIPAGSSGIPGWPVPGLNWVGQSFPSTSILANLDDWCSPLPGGGFFVDGVFMTALRGGCAFADKVTNVGAANGVGVVIVNNIPLAGAQGMSLGAMWMPGMPVIGLSYERGQQLLAAQTSTGADNIPELVYFDFAARWDPDPPSTSAVPEPASVAMLGTGLAAVTAARRRRRGSRHL